MSDLVETEDRLSHVAAHLTHRTELQLLSLDTKKPEFSVCAHKYPDEMPGEHTTDLLLTLCPKERTVTFLPNSTISSLCPPYIALQVRVVLGLVRNRKSRFSCDTSLFNKVSSFYAYNATDSI